MRSYCIGALSHRYALKIAFCRGLVASFLATSGTYRGAMMAVGLPAHEIQPMLDSVGEVYDQKGLVVACMNSPTSVTVSGEEDQIDALMEVLDKRGIFVRKLQVDVVSPSFQSLKLFSFSQTIFISQIIYISKLFSFSRTMVILSNYFYSLKLFYSLKVLSFSRTISSPQSTFVLSTYFGHSAGLDC